MNKFKNTESAQLWTFVRGSIEGCNTMESIKNPYSSNGGFSVWLNPFWQLRTRPNAATLPSRAAFHTPLSHPTCAHTQHSTYDIWQEDGRWRAGEGPVPNSPSPHHPPPPPMDNTVSVTVYTNLSSNTFLSLLSSPPLTLPICSSLFPYTCIYIYIYILRNIYKKYMYIYVLYTVQASKYTPHCRNWLHPHPKLPKLSINRWRKMKNPRFFSSTLSLPGPTRRGSLRRGVIQPAAGVYISVGR